MSEKRPLLNDPAVFPDEGILRHVLGKTFPVYEAFMDRIMGDEYGLDPQWRYYRDGKAWLCKAVYRKKTVFWLSVWDGFFRISFYFTDRAAEGIDALDIDGALKTTFLENKKWGGLKPMVFEVFSDERIGDILTVAAYKKTLK